MSLLTTLSSSQRFAKNVFFEDTHTHTQRLPLFLDVSRVYGKRFQIFHDISTNGQTSTADHDFQGPNAKDLEESLAFQALDETIGSRKRVTAWNCLSGLRSGRVRWIPALKCNAFWPKTCRRIIQVRYYYYYSVSHLKVASCYISFSYPLCIGKKTVNGTNGDSQTFRSGLCGHQQRLGVNVRKMFKHVQATSKFLHIFTGTCLYIEAMGTCIHYSAELETPFHLAH